MLVLNAFLKSEYLHQEDTLALLRSMSAFGGYKGRSKLFFLNPLLHLQTLGTACILCYCLKNIPELATLHPQLFQPLSAVYKSPKEMHKPGKLLGCQFSKCFALFLQRQDKATVRCKLYDLQSALTMNTAY